MTRHTFGISSLLAAAILGFALAPSARADEMSDLKARFKTRYAKLESLIRNGTVGETHLGTVEAVKGRALDATAANVVAEENADRGKLYAIIARQQKTTPAVVAARNARREFASAKSGEWLKTKDGWKKK